MRPTILVLIFTVCVASALAQQNPGARGFIGLALTDAPGSGGVVVGGVKPGGPADQAGVRPGDVVVAVNGSPVDQATAVTSMIASMAPNQKARLTVIRGSGSSARHQTIAVVVGSSSAGGGAARVAASPRAPSPSLPPAGAPSAPARPLVVSGYVRLTDPLEQAFTVDVPSGWRSEGGLARRAALQINPYVRSLSPDKMTYLLLGEPALPSFTPPTPMSNAIGHPEGTLYNAGLGGLALMMHYLSGAEFARMYGQSALQGVCPSVKFILSANRPDLARKGDTRWPTVIPSRSDGGEARFTCTHNHQEMEARFEAATRVTRDNVMWGVTLLQGSITPKGQGEKAEEILNHVADSMKFSQAWSEKQNRLSQEAAEAINRNMQAYFRQEQAFMQKLNSVDESFESMDEIVSGYSTYHDDRTGNNYSLSNTNPYKWIDDSTGRIISTPTSSKPVWAPAYRPLAHGSN